MSLEEKEEVIENPDPHFEPIISLPPVQVKTLEEDEVELVRLRAKLFRYDTDSEPREWKERGTGEVKILKHKTDNTCRVLMRRDKTFKICANHNVTPDLELKPNCGSDRAWVWSTLADFADEEPKPELLAIRFATSENAQKFKAAFDEAKSLAVARHQLNKSAPASTCVDHLDADSVRKQDGGDEGVIKEKEVTEKEADKKETQTNGVVKECEVLNNKDPETTNKNAAMTAESGKDGAREKISDVTVAKQLEQLTVAEK